jgi:hypothetical protein
MEYIIGILIALVGALFYSNTKRQSAEASLENVESHKELNKKDHDIELKKARLEAEEAKRAELEKTLNSKEGSDISKSDLEDFFNNDSN